ncbi:MAG: DoxX family protein [Pseudomonadota bacterium]
MSVETTPKAMLWTGRVLTGLFAAFMVMDTGIKLVGLPVVAQTLVQLGYPPEQGLVIGIIEAVCLALYLWPRTAVLGAVLFTAVMGGAVASHMRLKDPLVSHTLFGVWLGLIMWGGLWLRDPRLRAIIPLRA